MFPVQTNNRRWGSDGDVGIGESLTERALLGNGERALAHVALSDYMRRLKP
jgi:hypothetical protein